MATVNAERAETESGFSGVVCAFLRDEKGATAIEYSLIAGLIFLAIVASVKAYTNSTSEMYNEISSSINDA